MNCSISCGARSSKLSRVQVEEILSALQRFHPEIKFAPIWLETKGDKDKQTPLSSLGKTDFFTDQIDQMQLRGECRISIHSAKDLPDPLTQGLKIAALTRGVDPSDVLVLRNNESLCSLPSQAKIGTSSMRRAENVAALRPDLVCVDIRGTIEERLEQLDQKKVDGLVMAEAALIRLKLTNRNRIPIPGETAALQGQLAVLIRQEDSEMEALFRCIDHRLLA